MDRTFAEVRAAFDLWEQLEVGGVELEHVARGLPQAAYDANRAAARDAAQQIARTVADENPRPLEGDALLARITALVLDVAVAAWWQGIAIARNGSHP